MGTKYIGRSPLCFIFSAQSRHYSTQNSPKKLASAAPFSSIFSILLDVIGKSCTMTGFSLGRTGRARQTRRDGPIWSKPPRWRSWPYFVAVCAFLADIHPHSTGLRVSFGGRVWRSIPHFSISFRLRTPPILRMGFRMRTSLLRCLS